MFDGRADGIGPRTARRPRSGTGPGSGTAGRRGFRSTMSIGSPILISIVQACVGRGTWTRMATSTCSSSDTAPTQPWSSLAPAPETCDGRDQDCDGEPNLPVPAAEACNAQDDDCDGIVDDGPPGDAGVWLPDTDGDGYGAGTPAPRRCPGTTSTRIATGSRARGRATASTPRRPHAGAGPARQPPWGSSRCWRYAVVRAPTRQHQGAEVRPDSDRIRVGWRADPLRVLVGGTRGPRRCFSSRRPSRPRAA